MRSHVSVDFTAFDCLRVARAVYACAAWLLIGGGAAAVPLDSTTVMLVPFQPAPSPYVVIRLPIKGNGCVPLLFDTGTEPSVLPIDMAISAGFQEGRQVSLTTLSGRRDAIAGVIDRLVPGLGSEKRASAVVATNSAAAPAASGAVAIFGHAGLHHSDYLVDYVARQLVVAPAGSLSHVVDGRREPLLIVDGRPAVDALILAEDGRPVPVRLVIDTGATHITLFGRTALRAVGAARTSRAAAITDQFGSRVAAAAAMTVALAGRQVDAVAALMPDMTTRVEDGLLPAALFERVYVSVARGEAAFPARPVPVRGQDAPCR